MGKKQLQNSLMISEMQRQILWIEYVSVKRVQKITESFLRNSITSTKTLFLFRENVSIVDDRDDLKKEIREW